MPVVVNSIYSANNVKAGKIAGNEPRSVVDAGISLHSGGAAGGAVPVMNFGGKLQFYLLHFIRSFLCNRAILRSSSYTNEIRTHDDTMAAQVRR